MKFAQKAKILNLYAEALKRLYFCLRNSLGDNPVAFLKLRMK